MTRLKKNPWGSTLLLAVLVTELMIAPILTPVAQAAAPQTATTKIPSSKQAVGGAAASGLQGVPGLPNSPPELLQKLPQRLKPCPRYFVQEGKRQDLDSEVSADASQLEPLMADVPLARAELELYRRNQAYSKWAGYLGSVGVLVALTGFLFAQQKGILDAATGEPTTAGFVVLGGLGFSLNAYLWSFSLGHKNELHLRNAVEFYNQAHQNKAIELELSASLHF